MPRGQGQWPKIFKYVHTLGFFSLGASIILSVPLCCLPSSFLLVIKCSKPSTFSIWCDQWRQSVVLVFFKFFLLTTVFVPLHPLLLYLPFLAVYFINILLWRHICFCYYLLHQLDINISLVQCNIVVTTNFLGGGGGGGSSVGRALDSWFDSCCGRPLPTGWVSVSIMWPAETEVMVCVAASKIVRRQSWDPSPI